MTMTNENVRQIFTHIRSDALEIMIYKWNINGIKLKADLSVVLPPLCFYPEVSPSSQHSAASQW